MKTLFTILLFFFLYAELHSQWVQQNVFAYQNDLTSVCFLDPIRGYAIGNLGKIFVTDDGGNNWYESNSFTSEKLNSIFDLGSEPGYGITGYVAGENGTIIKLTRGWPKSGNQVTNVTVSLNSIYFTSADIGYCCGNSGTILKTTNDGAEWVKLTTGTTYNLSSIYFTDSNTGFAVGGQNTNYMGIILKTTNAGNTWSVKYSGQANRYLYSVHFENSTTGWACGWNGTVLKTTNGGTNWVLQTSNVTSHLHAIYFKSVMEGLAVGANGTIIVTTNGGTNWIKRQSGTTEQLNAVAVSGTNTAVAVGNKGIVTTNENGGTSWYQHTIPVNITISKVLFTSRDNGWIIADGHLYRTTDNGQNWNLTKTDYSMFNIYFLNNLIGWAINLYTVFKTTDGGDTWSLLYSHSSENNAVLNSSIYFINENTGWLASRFEMNDIFIERTTDGGKTWNYSSIGTYNKAFHAKIYFNNKYEGWVIGNHNDDVALPVFSHSTNGGSTWEYAAFQPGFFENVDLRDIVFTKKNKGYIVGGYSWFGGPGGMDDYSPHVVDKGALIIRTTDGGKNWLRKDYFFPGVDDQYYGNIDALNSISFPDTNTGYCVGSVILKTTNGGDSWAIQNSPVSDMLYSVCFTDADNGWAVGANGALLKHQKETVTTPVNWYSKIKLFTNDILKDSLIFGQNTGATNGLDKSLGELELPPIPPAGTFDARFILPDDPYLSTDKDLRSNKDNSITWNINLQNQNFPLKISWGEGTSLNLIPGEFYLQGIGQYGLSTICNMKDTAQVILDSLPPDHYINIIYHSPQYTIPEGISLKCSYGWNLISIPLKEENMNNPDIFSRFSSDEVVSPLFGFDSKYSIANFLENGKGYWVKIFYNNAIAYLLYHGIPVDNPVKITKGWNLIGPYDKNVPLSRITSQPANILTTPFYGYDNGYFSASTLNPGKGYWVKSSSDGVINYNTTGLIKDVERLASEISNSGKITITDNSGSSSTLFNVADKDIDLQQYELPPLPPSGIFDARYTSGFMAERLDGEGRSIIFNSASYPVTIKAEGIDLRLSYSVNGNQTEAVIQNGSSYTIKESGVSVVKVSSTSENIIPKQFALHQNYPNPFNPVTKIRFDLPEKSKVNLSVYNILGERIAELVNSEVEAGYHEVEFNAGSLSSGVYIYRIDTEKEHSVKKMVLLK